MDFVLKTVTALVREHGVSLHQETILHSDQGAHYTSRKFVQILEDKDLRQSMSGRGNCWDNAPRESFFGHMKDHISGKLKTCESYEQAKALIDAYMDYYNNERYQWELAKLSPNEYYQFCVTGERPLRAPNPPPAFLIVNLCTFILTNTIRPDRVPPAKFQYDSLLYHYLTLGT